VTIQEIHTTITLQKLFSGQGNDKNRYTEIFLHLAIA